MDAINHPLDQVGQIDVLVAAKLLGRDLGMNAHDVGQQRQLEGADPLAPVVAALDAGDADHLGHARIVGQPALLLQVDASLVVVEALEADGDVLAREARREVGCLRRAHLAGRLRQRLLQIQPSGQDHPHVGAAGMHIGQQVEEGLQVQMTVQEVFQRVQHQHNGPIDGRQPAGEAAQHVRLQRGLVGVGPLDGHELARRNDQAAVGLGGETAVAVQQLLERAGAQLAGQLLRDVQQQAPRLGGDVD